MCHEPPACCLIAEDQVLVAMGLEATLDEIGMAVAGPFPSCAAALAWIGGKTPEIALSDSKLQDGPSTDLVKALQAREVPVIICSGYPHGHDLPTELRGVRWLEKPITRSELLAAMVELAPSVARYTSRPMV
jgi:DNA-binding NtrC family response regulator